MRPLTTAYSFDGRAYGGAFTAASHGDREAGVANVTLASFCNCCPLQ